MPVKDVKIYAGAAEGWVSIGDLSTLPISSTDGTVKLDSPSANTFTVSIDGSQRVLVDENSSDFEGTIRCDDFLSTVDTDPAEIQLSSNIVFECLKLTRFNASGTTVVEVNGESKGVGINTVASDKAGLTVKTSVVNPTYGTQGVWSNGSVSATTQAGRFFDSYLSQPIIASASSCEVYHFRAYDNAASTTTGSHAGFVAGNLKAGTTKNYGFWSQVALEAGKTNYAFYASSTAPSYFNGDVITTTIRGKNNGLGSVVIADDVVIDGTTVIMEVGSLNREEKNIDFASNESSVAGGGGVYIMSRNHDLAFSSDEIRFNSNWSAGATIPTWVMTTDSGLVGNNQANYIKCGSVSGTAADDASVELGANLTVSTGGVERVTVGGTGLKVKSQNQLNETVVVSGNSVSVIDCDPENKVANTAFGVKTDGSYKLYMTQTGNVGIGDNNTNASQKLTVDGDVSGESFIQYGASTCGIFFPTTTSIEIHSSSSQTCFYADNLKTEVSGPSANDASIELGAELLTTNHTPTQPNSIATRQYVDDQSGSAGLIDFGTPTDDTTPDSPNGSTLHDNMFLYVKGTTSWRKSALYPLDSTGGGSAFPLPQPGQDAGIAWESSVITPIFGSNNQAAPVAVAGNAFFILDQWSVDGSNWFPTKWPKAGLGVTYERTLTVSYGQNVFCGHSGYSYDGQNWTEYTSGSGTSPTSNGSFFYQGKHFARGGAYVFDGESLQPTGMTGSGLHSASGGSIVVACNSCCVGVNVLDSTNTLQVYQSGDMSDGTNRWTRALDLLSGGNNVPQGVRGVARNAETDVCVALTNGFAWVQNSSGSISFKKFALPVSAAWAGITHDGNNYIAVASSENSNISIWSADGETWQQSTTLDNPGICSIAGFNGRAIASGYRGVSGLDIPILVSGNPSPNFRSLEFEGKKLTSQMQTNEFLMQEISRLQKLIEEKCDS